MEAGQPLKTKVRVRYQETDQMGIVHHSVYVIWFEMGRTAWLREQGINYKDLEKQGFTLPIVDLQCRFKASAFFDEEITIVTRLENLIRGKMAFTYEILNGAGQRLATGKSIHFWLNKAGKRVDLARHLPKVHAHMLESDKERE